MTDNDMDWGALARYLAGDSDAEERRRVEQWLAADPAHQDVLATFRAVADDADWVLPAEQEAGILAAVRREMARSAPTVSEEPQGATVVPFPAPARRSRVMLAVRRAAAIVLIAGGAAAGYFVFRSPAAPVATTEFTGRAYVTAPGQRATFQLADGSHVMLGPGSTLRTAREFGQDAREVALEGEAYFEVTHDEQRPFVVRAGDLVATDLGTEFTVRAYGDNEPARVVVREGLVAIEAAAANSPERRVLEPGQLGWLNAANEPMVEPADTALQFAWVAGRLVFRTTPLGEAVQQIDRWYGVDVRLASPELGTLSLTAAFRDEPISEVLRVVATALDLEVVGDGPVYTLRAR